MFPVLRLRVGNQHAGFAEKPNGRIRASRQNVEVKIVGVNQMDAAARKDGD